MGKIILIPPICIPDSNDSTPEIDYPPGIFSLINNLGADRSQVEILVLNLNKEVSNFWHDTNLIKKLCDVIISNDPDCVGFSSNCINIPFVLCLSDALKIARSDVTLIIGGPGVSSIDIDFLLDRSMFDSIFIHEAEITFKQFIRDFLVDKTTVKRLYISNGRVPLDTLTLITQESIDHLEGNNIEVFPLETGRGCPYSCTFCSTSRYFDRKYQNFSILHIKNAIDNIIKKAGVKAIEFVHDMFMLNKSFAIAIIEHMNEHHPNVKWGCSLRLDSFDDEILNLFQLSNIGSLFLGIESVSSKLLRFTKKGLTQEQIKQMLPSLMRMRSTVIISFIYGFPVEDESDLRVDLRFIEQIFLNDDYGNVIVQFHLLKPFIGSDIYDAYCESIDFSMMNAYANLYPENIRSYIYEHRKYLPSFFVFKTKYRAEDYVYLEKVIGYMQTYVFKYRLLFKFMATVTDEVLFSLYHWILKDREVSKSLFANPTITEAHHLINKAVCNYWGNKIEMSAISSLIRYSEIVDALEVKTVPSESACFIKLLTGDLMISQINLSALVDFGSVEYETIYYYIYREDDNIIRFILNPSGYTIFQMLSKGVQSHDEFKYLLSKELNLDLDQADAEVDSMISYLKQNGLV